MAVRDAVSDASSAATTRWLTTRRLRSISVALLVVGAAAAVVGSGVLDGVTDEEGLRSTVDGAGAWGPVVFVGLMVLVVPLNVPGLIFVIPATTLFGTVGGVVLSLTGGFLASMVGVVAARVLGRGVFERRMPPRIRRLEARLSQRGFWTVAALRTFTFLFQPVDWLCGLSSIRMRTVVAGTLVGLVPPTLFIALTGGGLLELIL